MKWRWVTEHSAFFKFELRVQIKFKSIETWCDGWICILYFNFWQSDKQLIDANLTHVQKISVDKIASGLW